MKFGSDVPDGAEKRLNPAVLLRSVRSVESMSEVRGSVCSIEFVESQYSKRDWYEKGTPESLRVGSRTRVHRYF